MKVQSPFCKQLSRYLLGDVSQIVLTYVIEAHNAINHKENKYLYKELEFILTTIEYNVYTISSRHILTFLKSPKINLYTIDSIVRAYNTEPEGSVSRHPVGCYKL